MDFWENFLRLLPWRPRKALAALYWHVTRRKVRARHRLRAASANLPFAYDLWISTVERTPDLIRTSPALIERWEWRPRFMVLLYSPPGCTPEQLERSIKSVEDQIYPYWTLRFSSSGSSDWREAAKGCDYLVPLRAGNALAEAGLFRFAEALQTNRSAAILYGDQDGLDGRGRRIRPWFKPQWNPEMFLAMDFLSQSVAIEAALASKVQGGSERMSDEGLAAALLEATGAADGQIVHVPHITCHVASAPEGAEQPSRLSLVSRHLQPLGATCAPGPFGTVKVCWPLPAELPLVSIIIPTKDKVELLRACVESVLALTTYPSFEILIVDNGSVDPESHGYFEEISKHPSVRVLRHDQSYNFSAINNFAAGHAAGSYLCLLNNDTEVVESGWLTEMMRCAVRPDVGAVGAKLLYADGSIQHAGVVVGMGNAAGHAHRFTPANDPGYFRHPHVTQFVTAVTAACLLVEAKKFKGVGGLDEQELAVAYNDVDLCLKLKAAGWSNVYVPHAVLLHHESKSRGNDFSGEHVERYMRELRVLQERWGTKIYEDPLHNRNLDRYSETFVIALQAMETSRS